VAQLPTLCAEVTNKIDVINGFKIQRADTLVRRWAGALYMRCAMLLFQIPIRDVDCDFRLLRKAAVKSISLESSSGAICVELVHKLAAAGYSFAEIPVQHYARKHGRSQFFTPGRLTVTIYDF